jgi:hypothetical protein
MPFQEVRAIWAAERDADDGMKATTLLPGAAHLIELANALALIGYRGHRGYGAPRTNPKTQATSLIRI